MRNRTLCLSALLLLSGSALAQDKTLTFDNASPAKTVHLLNGTSVSIGTTGNLVAKCVLSGLNCADVGSGTGGGSGTPPSASITASSFNTTVDANGAYNPGTKFTITPATTGASVCWRRVISGPASSVWAGAITTNLNTAVSQISVDAQSSTYVFRLDCFNTDGGVQSNEISVTTNNGPPPSGGSSCPYSSWVPTLNDYGFTQQGTPSAWLQLQGSANFPSSFVGSTSITVPKATLSGLVFLGSDRAKYITVAFTTPAGSLSGDLSFNPSQVPQTNATNLGGYYLTISRCPGDFRYNIASPTESTEFQACKSIRKAPNGAPNGVEAIRWDLSGVSGNGFTNNTCGLQPNTTYYLNYANINPDDGIVTGEHECPNNLSNCGVQFKSN